jgi:hypothetical protein
MPPVSSACLTYPRIAGFVKVCYSYHKLSDRLTPFGNDRQLPSGLHILKMARQRALNLAAVIFFITLYLRLHNHNNYTLHHSS